MRRAVWVTGPLYFGLPLGMATFASTWSTIHGSVFWGLGSRVFLIWVGSYLVISYLMGVVFGLVVRFVVSVMLGKGSHE